MLRDKTNKLANAIASIQSQPSPAEYHHGKQVFRGITMDQFAQYLSEVLHASVTNQTGLTGRYDIALTPPRVGPEDSLPERLMGILRNELGLELTPRNAVAQLLGVSQPGGATTTFNPPRMLSATTYTLRLLDADAAGLKPASLEPDPFGLIAADVAEEAMRSQGNTAGQLAAAGVDDASARNACINNLRLIDAAKQQWALEKGLSATNVSTWDDIRPYMRPKGDGSDPSCPSGGSYTIGAVGDPPTCTVTGHALQ